MGNRLKFLQIFALLLASCAGPTPELAHDAEQDEAAEQVKEKEKPPGLPFQVRFEGVDDSELRGYLEALSNTRKRIADPPSSTLRLKTLAKKDLPEFEKALRSRGYYDAVITVRLDKEATPLAVVFEVNLGRRYHYSSLSIKLVPAGQVGTRDQLLGIELAGSASSLSPSSPRPSLKTASTSTSRRP